MTTFRDLGVADELCAALEDHNIIHPFAIQELTIPLGVEGADVIGQARTGTGKTLAFGLPLLQRIIPGKGSVQALVVTPTRELCLQVAGDLEEAGAKIGIRVLPVYGGVPIEVQTKALRTGTVDIVVGTPGRLLDQYRRGNLVLSDVSVLVLDEADEMLDMGFLPDVEILIGASGEDRQTMLFSATMPSEIVALARRYMRSPTFIRAESGEPQVAPETDQYFFIVHRLDKPRVLARILQAPGTGLATVFVSTKRMADRLVDELRDLGVPAAPIHGDLGQAKREQNLDRFRKSTSGVLVATEVAARGLDITGVTHVVNYDCPSDEKMYLHRIGRTGRAGAPGVAITFAEHREVERVNAIRKRVEGAPPAEEIFSTSERLTELFDLPEETPWSHLSRRTGKSSADRSAREGAAPRDRGRAAKGEDKPRRERAARNEEKPSRRRVAVSEEKPRRERAAKREDTLGRERAAKDEDKPSRRRAAEGEDKPGRVRANGGERRRSDSPTRSARKERPAEPTLSAARGADKSEPERVKVRERTVPDRPDTDERRKREPRSAGRQPRARQSSGRDDRGNGSDRSRGAERVRSDRSRGADRDRGDDRTRQTGREAAEPRGPEVRATRSGEDARGDGQPAIERRVKVDHIP